MRDDDAFWKRAEEAVQVAMKLKAIMVKRGLTRCRTKCPRCGQTIHASLASRKNHVRMACEGRCGMNMME
jgi:ribosomal protein S27AE